MVGASARAKDQHPVSTATDTGDSRQARKIIPSPQALGGYPIKVDHHGIRIHVSQFLAARHSCRSETVCSCINRMVLVVRRLGTPNVVHRGASDDRPAVALIRRQIERTPYITVLTGSLLIR